MKYRYISPQAAKIALENGLTVYACKPGNVPGASDTEIVKTIDSRHDYYITSILRKKGV